MQVRTYDMHPKLRICVITFLATVMLRRSTLAESGNIDSEILLNSTRTWDDVCEPGNCTDNGDCHYYEPTGCMRISSEKQTTYWIDVGNTSSIIRLHLDPWNVSGPGLEVRLTISEQDNIVHTWVVDDAHKNREFRYLSQSPQVRIDSTAAGQINYDMLLQYDEIKFEFHVVTEDSNSGEISSRNVNDSFFRPNTARVYRLVPAPDAWNVSSVSVTVVSLDLEEGDYILIGAGNETFNGPRAAHLKGKVTKPQQYHIANDHAYIVFFRASSDRKFNFDIKWIRTGEQITKPDEDPTGKVVPDTTLQAVPVCFYNASWIIEFNKTTETTGFFHKFQTKFAEIANRYVKEKGIKYVQEIRPESVQLIQISSVLPPNDEIEYLENGALYAIIGIVQTFNSKMSVFRWHEMREILERFDAYDEVHHHALLGFKVGKCPGNTSYTSWFYATALVVIICAALFITVWLCSFNPTWKSRRYRENIKKLQRKLPRLPMQRKPAANEYVAYDNQGFQPPKVTLKKEQEMNAIASTGLNKSEKDYKSIRSDEDSDEEIFTQSWITKKRLSTRDLPTDVAFDMKMARMHRMHMFDVPLHDVETAGQPSRQRRSTKNETQNKGSNTSNQYIFRNFFDDDDDDIFDASYGTKL